ncbi:Serine/threonine-protein kinase H1 [Tulasnella sp. JGI-2019a]|nr:Serine/threonine-protein kinase H1 [Tulasnella sp. JGI-2019a]
MEEFPPTVAATRLEIADEEELKQRFRQACARGSLHDSDALNAKPKAQDVIRTSKASYDILAKIAKGGYGYVFEVQKSGLDPANSEKFACKVIDYARGHNGLLIQLPDRKSKKDDKVARALRQGAKLAKNELNIWQDLNDRHVLRLIDWVKEGKYKITFFMHRATQSLADHPVRQLSLDKVLRILVQIMDGVVYIHDSGYIHRDLKPPNVLLTEDGEELKVVIADFGISARGPTHTAKSGTLSWMSPEVQSGLTHDNKVDSYAIGLILWWMLYGSTYFKDSDTTPKIIDWDVITNEDSLVLDFLHKLLEESPKERWTVKAARRHPLVGHIAPIPATDTVVIPQGSVVESDDNASTSTAHLPTPTDVPAIPAASTSVAPIASTRNGPTETDLSEFIVEDMLAGDVSTSSDDSSAPGPPTPAGVRSAKRNRVGSTSSLLRVIADEAPSAKRRKANHSTSSKEINDEATWTLNRVRRKTAGYVKSVWGAARYWG